MDQLILKPILLALSGFSFLMLVCCLAGAFLVILRARDLVQSSTWRGTTIGGKAWRTIVHCVVPLILSTIIAITSGVVMDYTLGELGI